MIDFPTSPNVGDTFTSGGLSWRWDGAKWVATGGAGTYLPLAGGPMAGPMTVLAPAAPTQPATKAYVDALPLAMNDNRIINGDMRIDQRNNGALVTVGGYSIDRWAIAMAPAAMYTAQRAASAAMAANGFPYALNFVSTSAHSPAASDSFFAYQAIEADMVSDFAWGTAGAQPVTLSFWVNLSVAGTYSGVIANAPAPPTRCYPFSFAAIVGWTKVVITIPGDTAGTWVMSGNAAALYLKFDLGSGSSLRAPAGTWVNGNYNGATGAVGIVTTNGAVMQITGVKLEVGSVATPFNRQSMAKSLVDCQRYYQVLASGAVIGSGYVGVAGSTIYGSLTYMTAMRTAPSVAFVGINYGASSGLAVNNSQPSILVVSFVVAAIGVGWVGATVNLTAEL